MEKESKIIISSEDGEWGREPIQKLSQAGVTPLFLKRDSTLLLGKIREEKPQLVVMDFLMPGLDAIGVIHAVAQDASVENPLYIVTSSYSNPIIEREIASAGVAYFALSPYDKNEMADRILNPSAPACGCRSLKFCIKLAYRLTSKDIIICVTLSSWLLRTRKSSTLLQNSFIPA